MSTTTRTGVLMAQRTRCHYEILKNNIADMGIVKEEDTKAGTVNAIQLFAARRRRKRSRRLNQQLLSATAATQLSGLF